MNIEPAQAKTLLHDMLRVRRMEERCAYLYTQEKIRGFLHLYIGEEAVATGVMSALEARDKVVATYREHGHALLKGVPMNAIMAEMFGRVDGSSRGRGGSMHIFSREHEFYGGQAIVGGGIPLATGLALGSKMLGKDDVSVCFFGEGAAAEGEFHESMNLAAIWDLPVLFACENNGYAMGTALDRSESQQDIHLKAASYNIPAQQVDGMDVVACREAAVRAVESIRSGGGPQFIEFKTYRFRAHSMFDAELYREKAEVEVWKDRDPIPRFVARLKSAGIVDDTALAALEAEVEAEVEAAVAFADASPWEDVSELERFVYSQGGAA